MRATRAALIATLACAGSCVRDERAADVVCQPPSGDDRWFVDRSEEAGLAFMHRRNSERCDDLDSVDGPGVCAFDADDDGDPDLFLPNRAGADSAFYRNTGGSFVDATAEVGLLRPGDAIGCLAFDYDGDGDLDLHVSNIGPDVLYENDGGAFRDVTLAAGIDETGYSTSATAGDIDGDGDLDLFVARLADLDSCDDPCTPLPINCARMEQSLLYVNQGGIFSEESASRGLVEREPSLVSLFFDFDRDGDVDLYVGNDKGYEYPDRLYINDGSGHFVDRGAELGLDAPGSDTMGVDVGDLNLTGHTDLITTDYSGRPTRVFHPAEPCRNDVLPEASADFINWAVGFVDVDLDGDLDVFQTSGTVLDLEAAGSLNQLFLNDGVGGLTLVEPTAGSALSDRGIYRGAAFLDYDDDGDTDVVVTVNGGRARLLENVGARGNHVTVDVGTVAAGSLVTARAGARALTEHVLLGGGYLGSSEPRVTFGLGDRCFADVSVVGLNGALEQERVLAGEVLRSDTTR